MAPTINKAVFVICGILATSNFYWGSGLRSSLDWDSDGYTIKIEPELAEHVSVANAVALSSTTRISAPGTGTGYNAEEYQRKLDVTLEPLDVNTTSYSKSFFSGLCNQYIKFIGLTLLVQKTGFSQIIVESVQWKDTFGHNDLVPHDKLFDVVHWNSFYPKLPRFARYDEESHPDINLAISNITTEEGHAYFKGTVQWNVTGGDIWTNATQPKPSGRWPNQAQIQYLHLMKAVDYDHPNLVELEVYKEILKGAFRPHPFLQSVLDKFRTE